MSDSTKRAAHSVARFKNDLLLHVAMQRAGIDWSKATIRFDDDDAAKKDAKKDDDDARKDEKLDKLLTGLDSLGERLNRMDARMDSIEDKFKKDDDDDAAKKDAEEEEEKAKKKDDDDDDAKKDGRADAKAKKDDGEEEEAGKAKEVVADKKKRARKDEDEKEEKAEKKDDDDDDDDDAKKDSRADSVTRAELEAIRRQIPRQLTDEEWDKFASIQERADLVMSCFGDSAPRPLQGETTLGYRRRLADKLKVHSDAWKTTDFSKINDEGAFSVIEDQVYADAAKASERPTNLKDGQLREIVRVDATGRRISTFVGRGSFVGQFKRPSRRLQKLNTKFNEL